MRSSFTTTTAAAGTRGQAFWKYMIRTLSLQRMLAILLQAWRWIVSFLEQLWRPITGKADAIILMDTGRRIRMGKQIAEGGFSWIFEARDVVDSSTNNSKTRLYALKRMYLADEEMAQACLKEIGIHRSVRHPNVMPLFGMALVHAESVCYMLFPLIPHSLRQEVNERIWEPQHASSSQQQQQKCPWFSEVNILRLFLGICDGVKALHDIANVSHRDVKLENVLLQPESTLSASSSSSSRHHHHHQQQLLYRPILTDFGSGGPKVEAIPTRRRVLEIVEHASQHTTMPYRPPELFDGGVRAGEQETIDFTKVDVWSLGCTLFGILYGASPFECEFRRNPQPHDDGPAITIVECTQLRILGDVPVPPLHSVAAKWYSTEMRQLVHDMLHKDRQERPTLAVVMNKTEDLIRTLGGTVRIPQEEQRRFEASNDWCADLDGHFTSSNRNFV